MKITALYTYPVKGLASITLNEEVLHTTGLAYDRQWMLIDAKGQFVTQRQLPAMAAIRTKISNSVLTLSAPNIGEIALPTEPDGEMTPVKVWNSEVAGILAPHVVQEFFKEALGLFRKAPLRLVQFSPQSLRKVDAKYLSQGESANTFFSDGFPYLIVAETSLQRLNDHLQAKGENAVSMSRFRPNIVVDEFAAPFTELFEHNVMCPSKHYELAIRKPCERCPVTTIDQATGIRVGKTEPLATLREINPLPNLSGAFMGGNAILKHGQGQCISLGDELTTIRV